MHWLLLAGFCGLALLNSSGDATRITQKPRFYGLKTGTTAKIFCLPSWDATNDTLEWYWAAKYDGPTTKLQAHTGSILGTSTFLHLVKLRVEDSGVYFCKINGVWGPGTGLHVARNISVTEALYRTKVKDGLMIFQGLLLAVCIAAILLRSNQDLLLRRDSEYEEPETDHIYEGLAIDSCGGGLYEELTVYDQADGAEAPWE
ncbi:B-cell antigen receptor complex-associated protein beta chain [Xyrichtys novacula]|uniref:B-cell antigen receptor complex-associated protein beta chain n=1 Tax=Xyrichtys novacula TaxID=13765 RepID=A0AAV1H492_XYRNO|nr:B-cell antigen receptor complex-associated protein beta chain [Xyrichtys novacula]